MADVSIIIPVYNVEEYIIDCLKSVERQSGRLSIECIIIDDCSRDSSLKLAEDFIDSHSAPIKYKVLSHSQNRGQAAARNSGISAASGKYIFFLDSDDILPDNAIHTLWKYAEKYPNADFVQGDMQTFPEPGLHRAESISGKNFPEYSEDVDWIRKIFLTKFPTSPCSRLIKMDFITQNGLFFSLHYS